jgi:hypothetical protein
VVEIAERVTVLREGARSAPFRAPRSTTTPGRADDRQPHRTHDAAATLRSKPADWKLRKPAAGEFEDVSLALHPARSSACHGLLGAGAPSWRWLCSA